MSITTNKFRTETRERVATIRLTFNVTAEEIALALMNQTGACYVHETEVSVNEDAIRDALWQLFQDGLETASYRVGDNGADDRCAEVKDDVVNVVFGGREHQPVSS